MTKGQWGEKKILMHYKVNILKDSFSYAVIVLKLNWDQGTRLGNYNKEWSYFN